MTDEPRRLVSADVIRMQHELALAQATRSPEPSVSVDVETTAKGEAKPSVKVYAPMGCDHAALLIHAGQTVDTAVTAYIAAVSGVGKPEGANGA